MDDTGAPMTVQKELMRHASIQTTMNVYGKAMTDSKRQAHSKVVEMALKGKKSNERGLGTLGRCYWEQMGVFRSAQNPCNRLKGLVAGDGFEPPTFGL